MTKYTKALTQLVVAIGSGLLLNLFAGDAAAGGPKEIKECGTIKKPGSYVVVRNLPGGDGLNADHGCLVVTTDDVTIDLNGFNLVGDGFDDGSNFTTGIFLDDVFNVEIRNGTVRGFGTFGIFETVPPVAAGEALEKRRNRVINVRALSNGSTGIILQDGALIRYCTAGDNAFSGIFAGGGSTVIGNTANDNDVNGIRVGTGSTLIDNTARNNGANGFSVSRGSTVIGNTAYFNQQRGFFFSSIGNILVDGNTAFNNNRSGGGFPNFGPCAPCTFGTNHAP